MLQACYESVCESHKASCGAWMTTCGQITFAKEVVLCPSAVPHARGRLRVSADWKNHVLGGPFCWTCYANISNLPSKRPKFRQKNHRPIFRCPKHSTKHNWRQCTPKCVPGDCGFFAVLAPAWVIWINMQILYQIYIYPCCWHTFFPPTCSYSCWTSATSGLLHKATGGRLKTSHFGSSIKIIALSSEDFWCGEQHITFPSWW